jgi:mannose/cellobiose epimerase-like protein (N-acyl-D-glucosamine 2-epimerase family)
MSVDDQPDQESIAKLAYLLWESRGRPADSAKQDWSEAEALLAASKAAKAADAKAPGGKISTLNTPTPLKVERAKTDRRKSRAKKSTSNTGESDGPVTP